VRGKPENLVEVFTRKPIAVRTSPEISTLRAPADFAESLAIKALHFVGDATRAIDVFRFDRNEVRFGPFFGHLGPERVVVFKGRYESLTFLTIQTAIRKHSRFLSIRVRNGSPG